VSESANAPSAKSPENKSSSFSDLLIPVLTAIGTGIGVIGFVMFFGGFILWTRFDAAGLPANEAVAQVPRADLVATGASFLVPAVLAALAAAAIAVTGWDLAIGSRRRTRKEVAEDARLRATELLSGLEEERDQLKGQIEGCRARADKQRRLGDEAREGSPERDAARAAQNAAEDEANRDEERLRELESEDIPAEWAAQKRAADASRIQPTRRNPREHFLQFAIGVIPMLGAALFVIAAGWGGLSDLHRGLLVAVALGTVVVAIVVVSMTDHFAWYTVCVFLSVGVTIAVSTYLRTHSHAKVSPVAALSGPSPVVGFFVAETSDAVYVGRPQPAGSPQRAESMGFDREGVTLLRVPKSTLAGLTIGPIMDENRAYKRSLQLAMALCRRAKAAVTELAAKQKAGGQGRTAAGKKDPTPPVTPCSANEEKLLRNRFASAP